MRNTSDFHLSPAPRRGRRGTGRKTATGRGSLTAPVHRTRAQVVGPHSARSIRRVWLLAENAAMLTHLLLEKGVLI